MQALIDLLGGLGFLFLGMEGLSRGLSGLFQPAGERLDAAGGFLRGLFWTAAVQSSSAVTACLVSMSEAGILSAADCFPMLLGANVGTTLTVWLFSGLRSGALYGAGLPLAFFALLLRKRSSASASLLGLSLVLSGMELLQRAAAPLRAMAMSLGSPAAAFFSTLVFTAVIQSSAVSIGMLQQLRLTMKAAVPAILGANIGTCGTGLLAAALLGREGLDAHCDTVLGAKRLYKAARRNGHWLIAASLVGMLLGFYLRMDIPPQQPPRRASAARWRRFWS